MQILVSSILGFKAPCLQPLGSSDRGTHSCQAGVRGLSTHCCCIFKCPHHNLKGTQMVPTSGQEPQVQSAHQASPSWLQTLKPKRTIKQVRFKALRRLSCPALTRAALMRAGRNSQQCIWKAGLWSQDSSWVIRRCGILKPPPKYDQYAYQGKEFIV